MKYSDLSITVYSSGSTVLAEPLLRGARSIRFSSIYPGGYEQASFFLPRNLTGPLALALNMRIKIFYGLGLAWEGLVTNLTNDTRSGGTQVTCTGYFGQVLARRSIRKPWADTRIDESVWVWDTTALNAEKSMMDRNNRLRFTPKNVEWTTGGAKLNYTAPTGQTVKRVTFSYDLQEGAQNWSLRLLNEAGTELWSATSSGTGTVDHTLATPDNVVTLQFYAGATQTPASDGTIYGEASNVVVYTETGSINLTEITKDVRALVTELSAYEGEIDSNTYSLVPFVADPLSYADILSQAAGYGDSSYNPWSYGVWGSDLGADDKPVLFVEQQPALTDYDYIIRLDQQQMMDTTFEQGLDDLRNWIAVQYKTADGKPAWLTPDDVATHEDATSGAAYGELHEWTSVNTTDSSVATNYARRYLARHKDTQWVATSGLSITGHCATKVGVIQPAAMMRAGKRLKVANYLNDLSGSGLTWLITRCEYDHDTRSTAIEVGIPDNLAAILAQIAREGEGL